MPPTTQKYNVTHSWPCGDCIVLGQTNGACVLEKVLRYTQNGVSQGQDLGPTHDVVGLRLSIGPEWTTRRGRKNHFRTNGLVPIFWSAEV
jgi:hypothetical protein